MSEPNFLEDLAEWEEEYANIEEKHETEVEKIEEIARDLMHDAKKRFQEEMEDIVEIRNEHREKHAIERSEELKAHERKKPVMNQSYVNSFFASIPRKPQALSTNNKPSTDHAPKKPKAQDTLSITTTRTVEKTKVSDSDVLMTYPTGSTDLYVFKCDICSRSGTSRNLADVRAMQMHMSREHGRSCTPGEAFQTCAAKVVENAHETVSSAAAPK